ncbi:MULTISPECIES: hypothetical protein [unclassified Duganella]|nr:MULTISPECIES: hypothetical protein [unclassified Duganella]SDF79798.1 hypothetical protein SAMN05216320_1011356 [Duganella sp. OV458]SDI49320.1 hypothetical protein SAMN05428973_10159 [Duganella sp. OV510]
MKLLRDFILTAAAIAVLLVIYADRQRAEEESAARELAAWRGKSDK